MMKKSERINPRPPLTIQSSLHSNKTHFSSKPPGTITGINHNRRQRSEMFKLHIDCIHSHQSGCVLVVS